MPDIRDTIREAIREEFSRQASEAVDIFDNLYFGESDSDAEWVLDGIVSVAQLVDAIAKAVER